MTSPSEHFTMVQEEISAGHDGDSDRTTLQPMRVPPEGFEMHQEEFKAVPFARATVATPEPPPVCIPAEILEVDADPVKNPYELGDAVTFSAVVVGTEPLTYSWNSGAGSGSTFGLTVSDGNIVGKDETGLGHVVVTLLLTNACNVDGDLFNGSFPAKGTPPP